MGCVIGTLLAGDSRKPSGDSRPRRNADLPSDASRDVVRVTNGGESEPTLQADDVPTPDRIKPRLEFGLKTSQGWPSWLCEVAGEAIKDWTPRRANTFEKLAKVKCYMNQLLSGLEHCHNNGILHRDIKGSNLLINNEGILKIADFGLASFYDPEHKQPMTTRVVTLWYRPPELLLGATYYGVGVDLWSAGCILGELLAGKPIMPGRTEVEQLHKIFKLCGSPSEEYWKKSRLPNATLFKPQQPYKRCISEALKNFPPSSLPLIETLLAIEPDERGSATAALNSEFFTTEPYACEPSSLPKYPPSKEMDVKLRDQEARRQRGLSGKANTGDGNRRVRARDWGGRAIPAPEANAELHANLNQWRVLTQANAKSKSEKFPPPHQDGAVGHPRDKSHNGPVSFGAADTSFCSSFFESKSSESVNNTAATGGPSRRRTKRRGTQMAPSQRFFRAFIPASVGLSMEYRIKGKGSGSEVFHSRR
ncbi:probable serine/threonine-protein kinase At1g54610 isoform X3 [Camellia sinensis]|uniref:probable serine/threonine-protein kinase At1g54610 isoform X3 n=1 Tax=Camellia sinensis TaxID=4442 RepID=UPI0010369825|nr:probable serine/threonine-protein kinase At1g54610 isoform X3 [Camellia sinensis]